jgi:hypothetical protein
VSEKVIEKIDKFLLEEETKKQDRIRSGKWSPSSFGKCYRAQYWNRLNEPKTNPLEAQTLRVFRIGNLIHQFFQDILRKEYLCEVKVETNDVLGFADMVNIDEVIDIKSVRSFQFKLMKGKKDKQYDFAVEKKDNILQVTYYGKELMRKKGRLIFVDKDSLDVIEYEFNITDFEKELQNELDILSEYWNKKELPPARPRCYNGKECSYCGYSILEECKIK